MNADKRILNRLHVLKLFQFSNGDLVFSYHAYSIYKVNKPRMTKLGQGRPCFPYLTSLFFPTNFFRCFYFLPIALVFGILTKSSTLFLF